MRMQKTFQYSNSPSIAESALQSAMVSCHLWLYSVSIMGYNERFAASYDTETRQSAMYEAAT